MYIFVFEKLKELAAASVLVSLPFYFPFIEAVVAGIITVIAAEFLLALA